MAGRRSLALAKWSRRTRHRINPARMPRPRRRSRHLRRIVASYVEHYNVNRTHLALGKDAPRRRAAERVGRIMSRPKLDGFAARPRNTNRWPDNGSCSNTFCASMARPSMPLRVFPAPRFAYAVLDEKFPAATSREFGCITLILLVK